MTFGQDVMNRMLSFFNIGQQEWNAEADPRRRHVRYNSVHAEVTVGHYNYSVKDWSFGGVAFETAPDSSITIGDRLTLKMTFRFLHETITIQQPAMVVRSARRNIAVEFAPLAAEVRRQFERVMDGVNTQNFLESQAA